MNKEHEIRELILRLARLDVSESWTGDLNPAQRSVLEYLSRANKFSRSPSHVAAFLGTTRGTISQTFKALLQKGYVTETRSQLDKRAIRFDLTQKGRALLTHPRMLISSLERLECSQENALQAALQSTLKNLLVQNKGQPFGVCKACRHFTNRDGGGYCNLLSEELALLEVEQICHEQDPL
jgi:DNA-binding MarR family transcriptional regulator